MDKIIISSIIIYQLIQSLPILTPSLCLSDSVFDCVKAALVKVTSLIDEHLLSFMNRSLHAAPALKTNSLFQSHTLSLYLCAFPSNFRASCFSSYVFKLSFSPCPCLSVFVTKSFFFKFLTYKIIFQYIHENKNFPLWSNLIYIMILDSCSVLLMLFFF